MPFFSNPFTRLRSFRRTDTFCERSWRPPWLPDNVVLHLESDVHPHDPVERGEQFLAYNTGSTEIEVLNWLHSTVLLLKPENVLETGAADGLGTIALASACRANGFGRIHSVEIDATVSARAQRLLESLDLAPWVTCHCEDSREFLRGNQLTFQLAFFDSLCEIRAEELEICIARGTLKGLAVFHDTSPYRTRTMTNYPGEPLHAEFRERLTILAKENFSGNFFESTLSRGLTIMLPRRYPNE